MNNNSSEKIIKARSRVKKYGEVYTPEWVVNKMLDLLQEENKEIDCFSPEKTFLEPACGNGNFLVKILERKLKNCKNDKDIKTAVGSIYGIDILPDNVQESKERMQRMLPFDCMDILDRNIVCGNFLRPETVWFLKENKEERLSMCKYCGKDEWGNMVQIGKPSKGKFGMSKIEMVTKLDMEEDGGGFIVTSFLDGGGIVMENKVKANYCPMCGRKMAVSKH